MRTRLVLLMLLVLCGMLGGCVRFGWNRELRFAPPDASTIEELRVGKTDLEGALKSLGAPLWVWEHPAPDGEGAALAYGWYENRDLGFRASVPLGKGLSPSFNYDRIDTRMRGLVLFFDPDWKLAAWRTGLLTDLTREFKRRRPAYIEGSEQRPRQSG